MDLVARLRLERFLPVVVLAWCLGVAVGAVRYVGGWLVLRRIVNRATPAADALSTRVRALARTMGIHRAVAVLVSNDVNGPFTTGWLRPVIVLPLSMLSGLDPVHVNAIVAHELAHIRRWDYFIAIAQAVATTVLFHHPVTWWLDRRLRVEREYCCDDIAVAASQDRVGYVRALAELESLRLGLPSLALAATDGSLHDRVARVLAGRSSSAPAGWAPAATVLAVLFAATVLEAAGVPADVPEAPATDVTVARPNAIRVVDAAVQRISVIAHPDPSAPFEARWGWALDQAGTRGGDDVVIGWRVRSAINDGGIVMSSTDGSSDFDNSGRGQRVSDLVGASRDDATGVAIALTWSGGANGRLSAVRLRSLRSTLALNGRTLLWLHSADDASSMARLEQLLKTDEPTLRSELAAALTLHDDRAVMLRAVTRVFETDRESRVRGEAIAWLGSHADDPAVVALLRRAADDPDARVRDEAISALGAKSTGRTALLGLIASSEHADVRSEAVQKLAGGGDDVIPTLLKIAFEDEDQDVQAEAVDAIKETSGNAATRALRDIAQRHPSRRLRSEARDALDERGVRPGIGQAEPDTIRDRRLGMVGANAGFKDGDDLPLSDDARQLLAEARAESDRLHHEYLGNEHLVLALTRRSGESALLTRLGVDPEQVRALMSATLMPGRATPALEAVRPYTSRTKQAFSLAAESARALGHARVGVEHLLVGVLREQRNIGAQVLQRQGLTEARVLAELRRG